MIRLCEEERTRRDVRRARFEHVSVFDFDSRGDTYDLISAQGLIEYISPAQLVELCGKVSSMLAPGGAFVVGSRNRLFNAFSLNAFTDLERRLGVDTARQLTEEKHVIRAGVRSSGVSQNNRAMERHASPFGAYWRSYDFRSNLGDQNIFANPLRLNAAGGEIIFNR